MNRYFVAGVILGVLIAVIYRNITKPQPTPPDRNSKILTPEFGEEKAIA